MSIPEQVRALVAPRLAAEGLEVYDIDVEANTLRVFIDRADPTQGGIDLDAVSLATRIVSDAVDEEDPFPGASSYLLEVSSPGLERRLRTPEHFAKVLGETVKIKTAPGVPAERRIEGKLTASDADGFTVDCLDGGVRTLAYGDVTHAKTVFVWGNQAKPGKPAKSKSKRAAS